MNGTMRRDKLTTDGVTLDVVAEDIGGAWSLSIENEHGVRTNWDEFFDSPEEALQAGRRAIELEGVGEFVKVNVFG